MKKKKKYEVRSRKKCLLCTHIYVCIYVCVCVLYNTYTSIDVYYIHTELKTYIKQVQWCIPYTDTHTQMYARHKHMSCIHVSVDINIYIDTDIYTYVNLQLYIIYMPIDTQIYISIYTHIYLLTHTHIYTRYLQTHTYRYTHISIHTHMNL